VKEAPELGVQQRMEAVWRGRAHRLAQRPLLEANRQDTRPVIVLGIGKERYGIDFPDVAEILPPVKITPVPGAATVFAGVVNIHGEIRPVIDLRRLLGLGAVGDDAPARIILLRNLGDLRDDGREMGLRVDSVEHIGWIDAEDPESAGNTASKYIRRSTKDLLMLLSTEALFAELDI
jgi:chemotaxis signal transduction protein